MGWRGQDGRDRDGLNRELPAEVAERQRQQAFLIVVAVSITIMIGTSLAIYLVKSGAMP